MRYRYQRPRLLPKKHNKISLKELRMKNWSPSIEERSTWSFIFLFLFFKKKVLHLPTARLTVSEVFSHLFFLFLIRLDTHRQEKYEKKKSKTLAPLVLYVHISTWNRFSYRPDNRLWREMEIFLILLAIRGFANSTYSIYLSIHTRSE